MKFSQMPQTVISSATLQAAETGAIESGISRGQLMENAGQAVADEVMRHYAPCKTLVLCGPGNNGGDGFVAARHLLDAGWDVHVMSALENVGQYEGVAAEAAQAYPGPITPLSPQGLEDVELVIDALFGTGLNTGINGEIKTVIDIVNDMDAPVIAVDMPSGVNSDTGVVMGVAVKADLTVTFCRARTGHFLVPGCMHTGQLIVADIGVPQKLFLGDRVMANMPSNWLHQLRPPTPFDNKYTRGTCMVMGASMMTGAVKMAALASRRSGAGLCLVTCPPEAYGLYAATAMGEIIVPLATDTDFKETLKKRPVKSFLIGPGVPPDEQTQDVVLQLLAEKDPLVIDGGAISAFRENPQRLLEALHEDVILTPHEGEFVRLFPDLTEDIDKITRARKASEMAGCTLVYKGYDTVISNAEGECVINSNAPATLATAGSGDVLAGMIVGLLAHIPSPFIAAQVGVWMHGEAAQEIGEGLIAEDIIGEIPRVWGLLRSTY